MRAKGGPGPESCRGPTARPGLRARRLSGKGGPAALGAGAGEDEPTGRPGGPGIRAGRRGPGSAGEEARSRWARGGRALEGAPPDPDWQLMRTTRVGLVSTDGESKGEESEVPGG